jgi:hypothetical protein
MEYRLICMRRLQTCIDYRRNTSANIGTNMSANISANAAAQCSEGLTPLNVSPAEFLGAFFAAGAYYEYRDGVYEQRDSLWARGMAMSFMLPEHATMNMIKDADYQWNALIKREVEDINPNPYVINTRNGLYSVLDDTFSLCLRHHSSIHMHERRRR